MAFTIFLGLVMGFAQLFLYIYFTLKWNSAGLGYLYYSKNFVAPLHFLGTALPCVLFPAQFGSYADLPIGWILDYGYYLAILASILAFILTIWIWNDSTHSYLTKSQQQEHLNPESDEEG